MKHKITMICLALFLFLVALGIMLYPIISLRYNERHQAQVQIQYQQQLQQADTSAIQEARKKAMDYNAVIQPGAAFGKDALQIAATDYNDLLNLTGNGIMGYVKVPKIQVELPILHGTQDATLEKGVGHLLGTSLPVGGSSTHTVLTAHSGMASAKMFSDLDTLQVGDVFYLEVLGETLAYQVDQIKRVLPHDTTYLGVEAGADYCTLLTCTPFGLNTHRLLVRGHRIPYEEAEKAEEKQEAEAPPVKSTWEQEYRKGIYIALGGLLLCLLIWLPVYFIRKKKRKTQGGTHE